MNVRHICAGVRGQKKASIRSPEGRVTGSCDYLTCIPDMDTNSLLFFFFLQEQKVFLTGEPSLQVQIKNLKSV